MKNTEQPASSLGRRVIILHGPCGIGKSAISLGLSLPEQWKKEQCILGDYTNYTTQLCGDYNKPLCIRILLNNSGGVHKPGAELCRFATAPGRRFAPVGSIAVSSRSAVVQIFARLVRRCFFWFMTFKLIETETSLEENWVLFHHVLSSFTFMTAKRCCNLHLQTVLLRGQGQAPIGLRVPHSNSRFEHG